MKTNDTVQETLLSTFSNMVKGISLFIRLNTEVNKTHLSITQTTTDNWIFVHWIE